MSFPVIPYAASIAIDFNASDMEVLDLTGAVTFTTAHKDGRKQKTLKLYARSSSDCDFTFPASWIFIGADAPASIVAGKTAILTLYCYGTTDADVVAAYAEQP